MTITVDEIREDVAAASKDGKTAPFSVVADIFLNRTSPHDKKKIKSILKIICQAHPEILSDLEQFEGIKYSSPAVLGDFGNMAQHATDIINLYYLEKAISEKSTTNWDMLVSRMHRAMHEDIAAKGVREEFITQRCIDNKLKKFMQQNLLLKTTEGYKLDYDLIKAEYSHDIGEFKEYVANYMLPLLRELKKHQKFMKLIQTVFTEEKQKKVTDFMIQKVSPKENADILCLFVKLGLAYLKLKTIKSV